MSQCSVCPATTVFFFFSFLKLDARTLFFFVPRSDSDHGSLSPNNRQLEATVAHLVHENGFTPPELEGGYGSNSVV